MTFEINDVFPSMRERRIFTPSFPGVLVISLAVILVTVGMKVLLCMWCASAVLAREHSEGPLSKGVPENVEQLRHFLESENLTTTGQTSIELALQIWKNAKEVPLLKKVIP